MAIKMEPISTLPEETKIVSLTDARRTYRPEKCSHKYMTVDEELNEVTCDDCGAKLNPVGMLLRFAHEESRWMQERVRLMELHKQLDTRVRCKCQHCGKMTKIRM